MMPMTVQEVAQAVSGRLEGGDGGAVARMAVTDSRQAGQGAVFVAIAGEHVDGHDFVAQAARSGAVAAIVEHEVPADGAMAQIVVGDSVEALGALAKANLERRKASGESFSIIGITGSVGKTTTKDLLAAMLSTMGPTVAPVGSFNNEIGLPLTALRVGPSTRFLVAEMGANHLGEIARLTAIAPPDVAVVLKVGNAHLGEFGSVERIAQAKSEIVRGEAPAGVTILNADDAHVAAMAPLAPSFVKWFGIEHAAEHDDYVLARDIEVDAEGQPRFTFAADDGAYQRLALGIRGTHNVMNALAAASVARYFGMPMRAIVHTLESVDHISPHRMAVRDVEEDGTSFTLIDDSFNANPDSMRAGIDGLMAFEGRQKRPRVAVLGAMLELGDEERALHRAIGRYAVDGGADAVIAVGGSDSHLDMLASELAAGAQEAAAQRQGSACAVVHAHSADEADAAVRAFAAGHPGTVALLKGSHASGLSALAERWGSC